MDLFKTLGDALNPQNNIPKEHQLKCEGCGKILDKRDAGILAHGWIEDGKIVCYEDNIPYSKSKEVGKPIEFTKDKKQIDLN